MVDRLEIDKNGHSIDLAEGNGIEERQNYLVSLVVIQFHRELSSQSCINEKDSDRTCLALAGFQIPET